MEEIYKDEKRTCKYCGKDYKISLEERLKLLSKGGKNDQKYCDSCLIKWRRGKIDLK